MVLSSSRLSGHVRILILGAGLVCAGAAGACPEEQLASGKPFHVTGAAAPAQAAAPAEPACQVILDTSPWAKYAGNPVLEPTAAMLAEGAVLDCNVVGRFAGQYQAFFTNFVGTAHFPAGVYRTTSSDGIAWSAYSNRPVLEPQGWFTAMQCPDVLEEPGGLLRMYFHASGSGQVGAGYAESSDGGHTWTLPAAGPILQPTQRWWELPGMGVMISPSVVKFGGEYVMTYWGRTNPDSLDPVMLAKIGVAFSTDGVAWEEYERNPVVSHGAPGTWFSNGAIRPRLVASEDGVLHLYFAGISTGNRCGKIGHAWSPDGRFWVQDPMPVMDKSEPPAWDDGNVYCTSHVADPASGETRMYYMANGSPAGAVKKCGFATPAVPAAAAEFAAPLAAALGPSAPNPARAGTVTIPIAIAAAGRARLELLDVHGRVLGTLFDRWVPAGTHELTWNGQLAGADLPSGVYFYRLTAGNATKTEKLVRVR